ncbi:MAG: S1 family peptidase [Planctomycetota bacterium]|jgi:S1-C subfamily serine protease
MNAKQRQIWLGSIGGFLALSLFAAYDEQDARLRKQTHELHEAHERIAKFEQQINRVDNESRRSVGKVGDQLGQLWTTVDEESRLSRSAIGELSQHLTPNRNSLSNELLAPAVQLNGDDSVGSGTLIQSYWNPETQDATNYVLTAWHVVRDILREGSREIVVTIYQPGDEEIDLPAELVSKNVLLDSAVLKFTSEEPFEHVAKVLSTERYCDIDIWAPVYCVGCPLGSDPIPTSGQISSLRNMVMGANYWMINAPAYFGNSGGGIFLADGRELIGVFSKVYTSGGKVVSHMGLITPITSIREWLEEEDLAHVLDQPEADLFLTSLESELAEQKPLELPSLARSGAKGWRSSQAQEAVPPHICEKRD